MNTLFVIDYNGLTIAHLGNLKRVPNQAEVEALGAGEYCIGTSWRWE
jgi:hypothetical protein